MEDNITVREKRIDLVTGRTQGIGAAVGRALGAQGMAILVSGIDEPAMHAVREFADQGIGALALTMDLSVPASPHTDQFRQAYSSAIPMNRYGTPDEIAAAVAFLASKTASCMTGIAMPVDGDVLSSGARGI